MPADGTNGIIDSKMPKAWPVRPLTPGGVNRTFNRPSNRITLFVEVMNVFNRENVRFTPPGVNGRTGQAFGLFESMIPFVPSAGVLVEF